MGTFEAVNFLSDKSLFSFHYLRRFTVTFHIICLLVQVQNSQFFSIGGITVTIGKIEG
jgi:hypothetical protein